MAFSILQDAHTRRSSQNQHHTLLQTTAGAPDRDRSRQRSGPQPPRRRGAAPWARKAQIGRPQRPRHLHRARDEGSLAASALARQRAEPEQGLAPPRKVHGPRGPDPGPRRRRRKNAARPRCRPRRPAQSPRHYADARPRPRTTTAGRSRRIPSLLPRCRSEVARSLERDRDRTLA
nr:uncharacterized protein LOC127345205 [Lolium perenne]